MRFMQSSPEVVAALNLALNLKRMEVSLYTQATAAAGFIDPPDAGAINAILAHETEHVAALTAAIVTRSGTPDAEVSYDFTAGGAIPGFAFTAGNYPTFAGIAQGIEDLGTRALKGQLQRVMADKVALSFLLAMHAVEAEHAARVRQIRGQKAWITQGSRDTLPAFFQPVYSGDEEGMQGGVNVATLPLAALNGGADAATQAFDEPLTTAQVSAVMAAFVA